jgi:hypothetical protein
MAEYLFLLLVILVLHIVAPDVSVTRGGLTLIIVLMTSLGFFFGGISATNEAARRYR